MDLPSGRQVPYGRLVVGTPAMYQTPRHVAVASGLNFLRPRTPCIRLCMETQVSGSRTWASGSSQSWQGGGQAGTVRVSWLSCELRCSCFRSKRIATLSALCVAEGQHVEQPPHLSRYRLHIFQGTDCTLPLKGFRLWGPILSF